jgi:hypothetical protein
MNLMDSLRKMFNPAKPAMPSGLAVGEEVSGHWRYHLHRSGSGIQALCGANIMRTRIPTQAWGVKTHLNERYCVECAALAGNELVSDVKASS